VYLGSLDIWFKAAGSKETDGELEHELEFEIYEMGYPYISEVTDGNHLYAVWGNNCQSN
jgi:hypothetical protein